MMKRETKIKIAVVLQSLCQGLQYTVSPVLNQVGQAYPTVPTSLVQMLVTAPALTSMAVALAAGWLVTKTPKKRLVLLGCLVMGALGIAPMAGGGFGMLLLSRLLMGAGMGLLMSLSTAIIADYFDGAERTAVMGLQGAGAGGGVLLASLLGGMAGKTDFRGIYPLHLIAFVYLAGIALCLPESEPTPPKQGEKLTLNRQVFALCGITALEAVLFTAFTTNISMHLSGAAETATLIAGRLTALFSVTQIGAGLCLGTVNRWTKGRTLPLAVFQAALGGACLCLGNGPLLLVVGAIAFGLSQGLFIPSAMGAVTHMVPPSSVTLAAACVTISINAGQFLSPVVLNGLADALPGTSTTGTVFGVTAALAVLLTAVLLWKKKK